jgi:hypothetical protein
MAEIGRIAGASRIVPGQDIEVGAIFPQCSNDGRAKRHVFVVTRIGGGKNLNDGLGGDHFSPFFASESRWRTTSQFVRCSFRVAERR